MKITSIRKKKADGTWGEEIPLGAAAENIDYNGNSLTNVIGDVDVPKDGSIATQLNNIKNQVVGASTFVKEVSEEDETWEFYNGRWRYEILATEHKKTKIADISVSKLLKDTDFYSDVDFSFKKYFSGKIAIILDTKITGKIIIEGE